MKHIHVLLLGGALLAGPSGAASEAAGATPAAGASRDWADIRKQARNFGKALDRVADAVNEYGSITVSPPLLARPGADFQFDLQLGATNYYQSAKREVDADAASFEQAVQSFGLGVAAQFDPTLMAAGQEKLLEYFSAKARQNLKQGLVDDALERQLQADLSAAAGITNQVEQLNAIAAARQKYATGYQAADTLPAFPTAGGDALPGTPTGLAKRPTDLLDLFGQPKFANFQGLFADKPNRPSLSNRAALNRAAGDVATEAIYRMLGQPEKAAELTGREVMFGVVEVTVNPGWRTGRDYAADVSLLVDYEYRPARPEVIRRLYRDPTLPLAVRRKIALDVGEELGGDDAKALELDRLPPSGGSLDASSPLDRLQSLARTRPPGEPRLPARLLLDPKQAGRRVPTVFAVSPFSDIEVTDQASSVRRQDELALSLAFALRYFGLGAQAESFEKFVRSRQSDARSRSSASPITTYAQGGMVGFQVGPRFQAIGDPTAKRQRADCVLTRQSFPALLLFGVDKQDVYPKIRIETIETVSNGVTTSTAHWRVVEPHLQLNQIPSWRPLKAPGCLSTSRPRLREDDKLLLTADLNAAFQQADGKLDVLTNTFTPRTKVLTAHAFGATMSLALLAPEITVPLEEEPPAAKCPAVRESLPNQFTLTSTNRTIRFVVLGKHLDLIKTAEIKDPAGQATVNARLDGGALRLEVTVPAPAPGAIVLELPVDQAKAALPWPLTLATPPVFLREQTPPATPRPETQAILRTRELRANPQQSVERVVELAPGATADQLAAAQRIHCTEAQGECATNAPSARVNVTVDAQEHH